MNQSLSSQLNKSNDDLKRVFSIFNEIETKTNLINDIVFQTKLLSFNASVEAARAGEHGKGFAVVAEEVGNLAQMSGKASTEIFNILSSSQSAVQQLIQELNDETDKIVKDFNVSVEESVKLSNLSKENIDLTIRSLSEINHYISDINTSTAEQVSAVGQISEGMINLQKINKENEDGSVLTTELLEEVKTCAMEIENNLKVLVYGKSA